LADNPSAADPGRQSRTDRTNDAARGTTAWRRAAAAVGVVALLVVAGFLLLGGDVPLIDDDDPGEFGFELKRVRASSTSRTPPTELEDVAQEAGGEVKETMDELYFQAFVDPSSWGDYGAAFELFDEEAAARAEADTEVLTLGSTAGDVYRSVEPQVGTLSVVILTDPKDAPVEAVVKVLFRADARLKDGSSTILTSSGAYFLRWVDGEWRIFAYRLDRNEQAGEEPSPTEEAS
jgi:hypothetical protein